MFFFRIHGSNLWFYQDPRKSNDQRFGTWNAEMLRSCNRWFTRWFTSSEWPQMCLLFPWALEKQNNVACRSDVSFPRECTMFEIDVPLPNLPNEFWFSKILGSNQIVCDYVFVWWEFKLPWRKTTSASHFHRGETCNVRSGKLNFLVAYLMRCQDWEPGI